MTPREKGEAAIAEILKRAPYARDTREHVEFVKGLVMAAGNALALCKPNSRHTPEQLARLRQGVG